MMDDIVEERTAVENSDNSRLNSYYSNQNDKEINPQKFPTLIGTNFFPPLT